MSLAFHGLVLACLPLLIFSQRLIAPEQSDYKIVMTPKTKKIDLTDLDLPRTAVAHAGAIGETTPSENTTVIDPTAEISDKNESDDNDDHHERKGQSLDRPGRSRESTSASPAESRARAAGRTTRSASAAERAAACASAGPSAGARTASPAAASRRRPTARSRRGSAGSRGTVARRLVARERLQRPVQGRLLLGRGHERLRRGSHRARAPLVPRRRLHAPEPRELRRPHSGMTMRYGDVIKKGLAWLISRQSADGVVGMQVGDESTTTRSPRSP